MNNNENASENVTAQTIPPPPKFKIGDMVFVHISTRKDGTSGQIAYKKIDGYVYRTNENEVKLEGYCFTDNAIGEENTFATFDEAVRSVREDMKKLQDSPEKPVKETILKALGNAIVETLKEQQEKLERE